MTTISEQSSAYKSAKPRATSDDYLKSTITSENVAIQYLHSKGIPALPGKALHHSYVDVIAFGCIEIEVKHARLEYKRGVNKFSFSTSITQQKKGLRANIVMLMCNYGEQITYHLFDVKSPVFYMGDRLKTAFTFTPGDYEARKHGNNRVVMNQSMMDDAQDNISLIYAKLKEHCATIKLGA